MPTSTSARDPSRGRVPDPLSAQQPDRGGVQKILGPLLVLVQECGPKRTAFDVQVGARQGVGVLQVDGADARGTAADDAAKQHDLLQEAVEHQALEGQQGDLAESAEQKSRNCAA